MSKGRLNRGYDTGYGTEDDVVAVAVEEEEEEMGEEVDRGEDEGEGTTYSSEYDELSEVDSGSERE